ncbi:RluA family pseudouridine synthase [Flavobacteriales bacterium]|nr:RluA family pseudouridine synthase [Flavobacteriales bacterium]
MQDFELNDELYEHFSFKVDKGQEPLRIDKFLMNRIENASRNKIQLAAKNGSIKVNNISVKQNYRVKPRDEIKVMFSYPPFENLLKPEKIDFQIIYEDRDLLVVNKPPNLVVHPGHGNYSGTLLNGILYHVKDLPENNSGRPGLVHRIDKDTSGLLVVAKSEIAMRNLSEQFFLKQTKRNYIALVWGSFKNKSGSVNNYIGRDKKNRMIMSVSDDKDHGKNAITHYKVLEDFNYVSLLECRLETGRTHQIRAHMKYLGNPIFNDERYGGNKILKGTIFTKYKQFVENCFKLLPRQALHAKSIGFNHPRSNKIMSFESELPNDIQLCLEKWKNYSKNN